MTFFAGNKVSKADRGESDDHEVDGVEGAPSLDVLEDDGRQGHKDEAAEQDEEQRGEDADLCLADFPLLEGRWKRKKKARFSHSENKLLMKELGNCVEQRLLMEEVVIRGCLLLNVIVCSLRCFQL